VGRQEVVDLETDSLYSGEGDISVSVDQPGWEILWIENEFEQIQDWLHIYELI